MEETFIYFSALSNPECSKSPFLWQALSALSPALSWTAWVWSWSTTFSLCHLSSHVSQRLALRIELMHVACLEQCLVLGLWILIWCIMLLQRPLREVHLVNMSSFVFPESEARALKWWWGMTGTVFKVSFLSDYPGLIGFTFRPYPLVLIYSPASSLTC